jgi:hypothetical protein
MSPVSKHRRGTQFVSEKQYEMNCLRNHF